MNNFCTHCGKRLKPNANFCSVCGEKVIFAKQISTYTNTYSKEKTGIREKRRIDVKEMNNRFHVMHNLYKVY